MKNQKNKDINRLCIMIGLIFLLFSCSRFTGKGEGRGWPYGESDLRLRAELIFASEDSTYGYTIENPIKVGGGLGGSRNEQLFLRSLFGPEGQIITFERQGSCCPFETENGIAGIGLLDIYEIKYKGLKKPIILYINMYDYEEPKIPVGFKGI